MDPSAAPKWAIPATNDLIYALGRVVYNFAQLDVSAERLQRGLADRLGLGPPNISLEQTVAELEGATVREAAEDLPSQVLRMCRRYIELKARRDELLCIPSHGVVADAWSLEKTLKTAHDIEIAAIEVNRLLRRFF